MNKTKIKNTMENFTILELEELANNLIGYDEDNSDHDADDLSIEKFDCAYHDLMNILTAVTSKVDIGISPITNEPYIGFSDQENGHGIWLAKRKCTNFIGVVLEWMEASEEKDWKGYSREITLNGVPQFQISVEPIKEK